MSKQLTGYELSRQLFDFAFERPKCKVQHIALFLWIVELSNRLGWKKQFGLPTNASMEGLSIGDKRTYLSALKDLQQWGFIKIVQEAKNQFQSCIIEICHSRITTADTTANVTALDSAVIRHSNDTNSATRSGTTTIDKQVNKETKKSKTNKTYGEGAILEESAFFNELKTIWFKHHPKWQFSGKDGAGIKSIVQKLTTWQKDGEDNITPNSTAAAFDYILSHQSVRGNNFLSTADPMVLNSKLNSIYEQIKNGGNGTTQFFSKARASDYDTYRE